MENIAVSIEWDGLYGPRGPHDIKELLESRYKSKFKVHWLNTQKDDNFQKLTYTPSEVAKLLGISKTAIYSLVYQKQIPAINYGKRWLIPKQAIEKLLGETIEQTKIQMMNEIERATLVTTTEEALKLYDLLKSKLELLVKHLSIGKMK
jgi:excisionase family DNA binding protein